MIVFDDAETLVSAPAAAALVEDLVAADSPVVRVAVATRCRCRYGLRSSGAAAASRSWARATWRSRAEECAELVHAVGNPQANAERLFASTEGWPLGAALGAVHADLPSPARGGFAGAPVRVPGRGGAGPTARPAP